MSAVSPLLAHESRYCTTQFIHCEGLSKNGVHGCVDTAQLLKIRGHHKNRQRRGNTPDVERDFPALHPRHGVIQQDQIEGLSAENIKRLLPVLGFRNSVPINPEQQYDRFTSGRVVLYNKYTFFKNSVLFHVRPTLLAFPIPMLNPGKLCHLPSSRIQQLPKKECPSGFRNSIMMVCPLFAEQNLSYAIAIVPNALFCCKLCFSVSAGFSRLSPAPLAHRTP